MTVFTGECLKRQAALSLQMEVKTKNSTWRIAQLHSTASNCTGLWHHFRISTHTPRGTQSEIWYDLWWFWRWRGWERCSINNWHWSGWRLVDLRLTLLIYVFRTSYVEKNYIWKFDTWSFLLSFLFFRPMLRVNLKKPGFLLKKCVFKKFSIKIRES